MAAMETTDGGALMRKVDQEIRKHEGRLPRKEAQRLLDHAESLRSRDHAHKRDAFNIKGKINRYIGG